MAKRKQYRCPNTVDWVEELESKQEQPKKKLWKEATDTQIRDVWAELRESLIKNGNFTQEFFERVDKKHEKEAARES
jgi:hypothetical protein